MDSADVWTRDPRLRWPWEEFGELGAGEKSNTFPGREVRMLEIVLVEREATEEIVGGLGKWTLCQKVSEELSYPAGHCGRLLYIQKGDLLLVCSQGRGKQGPFIPASVDSQWRREPPHAPQVQPHWLPLPSFPGKSPGAYPGWPEPVPSGPRTGWARRTNTSCPGGWLRTRCSRCLRRRSEWETVPHLTTPRPFPTAHLGPGNVSVTELGQSSPPPRPGP